MDQLEGEILQYEAQLAQVKLAAAELPNGPEKKNLCALEADLKEIITLSKSTLAGLLEEGTSKESSLDEEYDLFKSELAKLDVENVSITNSVASETRNLDDLKGNKCQAPFTYKWTNNVTYHNAFITHVPEADIGETSDVNVRVMFTNPTHKEMLPCPYYLEGDCKFTDDKCRYSHGELVSLKSLKEYREPEFSKLCAGCKILAKQEDGLWYRASVVTVNETHCVVKFESNFKEEQIPFHNILPLDSVEESISSDSDDDDLIECPSLDNSEEIVKRILTNPPGSALGEWEKFTKGFGSKIMAKMGYIHGSGLGKDGAGRVEPVSAVILPAGKSLDHCMMLKEKAGNDKDLFKAEKKMKYLQKKHEQKLKKAMENEKEGTDVFTFLNKKLDFPKEQSSQKVEVKNQFKNETNRSLSVTSLQLAEESRRVEKEIKSLNQSLARHTPHSHAFNVIKGKVSCGGVKVSCFFCYGSKNLQISVSLEKLVCKESKLSELHACERKLRNEQDQRRARQKLTIF